MSESTVNPPVPPAPELYGAADSNVPSPPRIVTPQRSPGIALVLSFMPGLGHAYLALYTRAAVIFLSFLAAIMLARHNGVLGLVATFVWFFGLVDAYRQAQLLNLGGPGYEEPPQPSAGGGTLGFGVFLTVVGGVLLIDRFYPIDLAWLADWWPAILVVFGLYLIGSTIAGRRKNDRWPPDDHLGTLPDEDI